MLNDIVWLAVSNNDNPIRLTSKVWFEKILPEHPEFSILPEYSDELRKAIEEPEYIVSGWQGEKLALRWCEKAPKNPKYLCVVYREYETEGFVITAFFISKYGKLLRRNVLWRKQTL